MFGALLYLRLASLRNLVVSRVRRLRQPKYLFGALAGAGYFYFFILRRLGAGMPRGPAATSASGLIVVFGAGATLAFLVVRMALAWVFPPANPGLRFSEAEIAFLFPAPVRRRTLIMYRLLSSQFAILLSSVLVGIVTFRMRSSGGPVLMRIAGWWVMLSIFELHGCATALTLAGVRERGGSLRAWRLGAAAIIGLYAAAVLGSLYVYGHLPSDRETAGVEALLRYAGSLATSGPLGWLLLPFRIIIGPLMATGLGDFMSAMVPALILLVLHFIWAVRTETAFEEGSLAQAERQTAAAAAAGMTTAAGDLPVEPARRSRAAVPIRAVREPFRLNSTGRPEVAFFWKNLLSIQGFFFTRRARGLLVVVTLSLLFALRAIFAGNARAGRADLAPLVVGGSVMAAFYTLLLGPQLARQDLRSDLANTDILKSYPLAGWQVALGELLAPTAILTAILWLAILAPAIVLDPGGGSPWLGPGMRATIAVCLAVIAPILCMIQLLVPNLLMIFFPAWYQASRSRGVEAMGQRLIFVFGQLVVAVIAIVPAAVAAAVILFASQWLLGPAAAVALATVAAAAILGGEAAVGIWWLGSRFEDFDLSSELRP